MKIDAAMLSLLVLVATTSCGGSSTPPATPGAMAPYTASPIPGPTALTTPSPAPNPTISAPSGVQTTSPQGQSATETEPFSSIESSLQAPLVQGYGGAVDFTNASNATAGATVRITTTVDPSEHFEQPDPGYFVPIAISLVFNQNVALGAMAPSFAINFQTNYNQRGIIGATLRDDTTGTAVPIAFGYGGCGSVFSVDVTPTSPVTVVAGDVYTVRVTDTVFGATPSPRPSSCPSPG